MAKTFKGLLNKNQESKRESNLETENQRLREKLASMDNIVSKDVSFLKLKEIKLTSNIRADEFNYNYEEIETLAQDILRNGQLQPVLISKDHYLIAGFRRYHAISYLAENNKGLDEILTYKYDKTFQEISQEEFLDLQLAENIQRRDLDNFQLSNLYHDLLNNGYNQQQLAVRFKKSKSFVSMLVSIKNIDLELVKLLKQFQVFGWSEKKFNALNFPENPDEDNVFVFEKLKGIIGILPLNQIAKQDNVEEQKKEFLKLFKNRLTESELADPYFSTTPIDKVNKADELTTTLKYNKLLKNSLQKMEAQYTSPEAKKVKDDLAKHVAKIEGLLEKLSTLS